MGQLLNIPLALQTIMCAQVWLDLGQFSNKPRFLYVPVTPYNSLKMELAQKGASGDL